MVLDMLVLRTFTLSLLVAFIAALPAHAQDDEAEAATGQALYIPLLPPFVVNYGGVGRLRYLKAELTVRVGDISAAQSVRHHMPAIRDKIVTLLSQQEELVIDTQEGKEQLRQDALKEIRQVIELEQGSESGVVDLFFDNFIVQR
ncbi:flagellar basal body-associated FliL family protein [Simiduia curdlanivorans]